MSDPTGRERLYSDEEFGALIQRATEVQREASESSDRGLTIREIETIAAEIGIHPEHLRTAALELENRLEAGEAIRFWGGPFVLEQKRVVAGTLQDEQWEQIVLGLRRLTGSLGHINEIGRMREWTRTTKDLDYIIQQTQVTLSRGDDLTTIAVTQQYRGGAILAYVMSLLLSGTIAGIVLDGGNLSDLMNAVVLGGSGLGGLAMARTSIAYWGKRQRKKLNRLTNWLQNSVTAPGGIAVEGWQGTTEVPVPPGEAESRPLMP